MGYLFHNDRLCLGPGVIKAALSTPPGALWVFGAQGGDGTRQGAEGSGWGGATWTQDKVGASGTGFLPL